MTELDELETGIGTLKKTSNEQKRYIEELRRERSFLIKKNNEIEESIKKVQEQTKPTKFEINELKKELEAVSVLIQEIKKKESKFESMLTEQRSNLFLLKSSFEKNLDRLLEEIEGRVRENKRIELAMFNELKSKVEKLAGMEDRLKEQSKNQKMVTDRLIQDVSRLQQTVTGLTSKNFDVELENLSKKVSSETKSLVKQITGGSETILGLRDKLQYFEPVVKDLSERLESQIKLSNKMMGSMEFLVKKSETMATELKSLKEGISLERERTTVLEQEREARKKDAEEMKEHLESTFQQTLRGKTKELEANIINKSKGLEDELKYLSKDLSSEKERMTILEQDLKNQGKNQESKTKELADSIEKIQLGEAKREENFNNVFGRLQELQIRTEKSLKSLDEKITQISNIEGNLERKIHKQNEAIFKRLGSSYDELDERVLNSDNTMSRLDESVKGLSKRLEDQFILLNEIGKNLSILDQEVKEQAKSQESHLKDFESVIKIIDDIEKRILNSGKKISRIDEIESGLTNESKSLAKDMYSERERVAVLEQDLKNQLEGMLKNQGSFEERISDYERLISRIGKAVTDMRTRVMDEEAMAKKFEEQSKTIDKVTNVGKRLTRLEEKMSNQETDHDLRFNELIAVIKDIEFGEAKRREEFKGFIDRFQDLKTKTEQNLRLFSKNVKKLSSIKSETRPEMSKEKTSRLGELVFELGGIKKRVRVSGKRSRKVLRRARKRR